MDFAEVVQPTGEQCSTPTQVQHQPCLLVEHEKEAKMKDCVKTNDHMEEESPPPLGGVIFYATVGV